LWRHILDRAVQSHRVVAIHIALNQAARIFHRQRRERPNAFAFKRLAFQFSVRLRIKRFCRISSVTSSSSKTTMSLIERVPCLNPCQWPGPVGSR
jgi:hypothetical protein